MFQNSNPTQWTFSGAFFFFFYQTLCVWQYSYQYLALCQLLTLTEHTTKKDLVNSILVAANLSCWLSVIICQYARKTYCCNNAQYQNFVNVPLSFCAVCCRLHLVTTTTTTTKKKHLVLDYIYFLVTGLSAAVGFLHISYNNKGTAGFMRHTEIKHFREYKQINFVLLTLPLNDKHK